jgi:MtfA peptidase
MPGDSLIIINKNGDSLFISDTSVNNLSPEALRAIIDAHSKTDVSDTMPDPFLVMMGVFAFILLFGRIIYNWFVKNKQLKKAMAAYETHYDWYDDELSLYNQYYKDLPATLKPFFLQRTAHFMFSKNFVFTGITEEPRMRLLISAAAVQLCFGLEKYLLDYFKTIYVYRQDYRYGLYNSPFMGHVSNDGIHLSWNNFLRGYENYTDADNVGIHEMAHALTYVNFVATNNPGEDIGFKKRFKNFSKTARPIFLQLQQGAMGALTPYAATNYNEFWAVSVETFFEKPAQLKQEMPQLYTALSQLLNQDPLTAQKIINIKLMG